MNQSDRERIEKDKYNSPAKRGEHEFWLTPPALYNELDTRFEFDFDPCPYPKPDNFDSLKIEWGKSNYVNPPFRKIDGGGYGPTAWVRKGIEEFKKGKRVVFMIPTQSYVNLLVESGAKLESAGRVRWISGKDGSECKSPSPITRFILDPDFTTAAHEYSEVIEGLKDQLLLAQKEIERLRAREKELISLSVI